MKALIKEPVNDAQKAFNLLCEKAGGTGGGPSQTAVLDLLKDSGQALNRFAISQVASHLSALPEANPWHVCFAIGLSWGHLAKLDIAFTEAATIALRDGTRENLQRAGAFHLERGPQPIIDSLTSGRTLFSTVLLPDSLPSNISRLDHAQQRWLTPIISPNRPRYMGAWNATAMFMVALFAQPELAQTHKGPQLMLPPGGPIHAGLSLMHRVKLITRPPVGSDLDDAAFEPGAIYENNALLHELCAKLSGWGLIDVHSGVYMLGTRHPQSKDWV